MENNNTQFRRPKANRPAVSTVRAGRNKLSSNLSVNYALMLQLYYLNKKQYATKKELKYEKLTSGLVKKSRSKPLHSMLTSVAHFFTENISYLKRIRPGIALVTE